MLAPLNHLDQLQARLDETIGQVPCDDTDGFASLALELPRTITLPPELDCPGFSFIQGKTGELRAGRGVAAEWIGQGPGRLRALRSHAQALTRHWRHYDPDETGFSGFAMLGFAASPATSGGDLPNAVLWLPELGLCTRQGQSALVLSTRLPVSASALRERWHGWLARLMPALTAPLPEPLTPSPLSQLGSLPDLADWQALVEEALTAIRRGTLDKVVLCRRSGLKGRRPFDARRLLAALVYLFPACQIIGIRYGGTRFVAATPERLLRLAGQRVDVDAIAGTAPRSARVAQDAALTAALMASNKERREHAIVVAAVRAVLDDCCDQVQVPTDPVVMQLHNAQHLWSPVSGRLRAEVDLFDLAARLHPTPATNGHPRSVARDWLERAEPLERGWYTGAAGILEPDPGGRLNGDLWVLLRCAELHGDQAQLYAGAGIVRDSNPLAEWRETEHKLAAIATALKFA